MVSFLHEMIIAYTNAVFNIEIWVGKFPCPAAGFIAGVGGIVV